MAFFTRFAFTCGRSLFIDVLSISLSDCNMLYLSMDSLASWNPIAIGRHQIINGDCTEALKSLPSSSVDVVVFSPPWNIGVAYRSYDDRKPREAYLDWMRLVAERLHNVLKPHGSLFLNVGATNHDPWIMYDVGSL